MKQINHLTTYKNWMKKEKITHDIERFPDIVSANGLCYSVVSRDKNFQLFDEGMGGFWAFGEFYSIIYNNIASDFTPLRQNIVLFLATMRNQI
jgi:hypothetical protein